MKLVEVVYQQQIVSEPAIEHPEAWEAWREECFSMSGSEEEAEELQWNSFFLFEPDSGRLLVSAGTGRQFAWDSQNQVWFEVE